MKESSLSNGKTGSYEEVAEVGARPKNQTYVTAYDLALIIKFLAVLVDHIVGYPAEGKYAKAEDG
ncbi:MAG: hypothetical protein DHS20C18_47670 [Saprospiraceae bacterium]|nr:MAG: hypothetical protein DHS20C18_47670 [Saprospiraceae bacterium]